MQTQLTPILNHIPAYEEEENVPHLCISLLEKIEKGDAGACEKDHHCSQPLLCVNFAISSTCSSSVLSQYYLPHPITFGTFRQGLGDDVGVLRLVHLLPQPHAPPQPGQDAHLPHVSPPPTKSHRPLWPTRHQPAQPPQPATSLQYFAANFDFRDSKPRLQASWTGRTPAGDKDDFYLMLNCFHFLNF